MNRALITHCR